MISKNVAPKLIKNDVILIDRLRGQDGKHLTIEEYTDQHFQPYIDQYNAARIDKFKSATASGTGATAHFRKAKVNLPMKLFCNMAPMRISAASIMQPQPHRSEKQNFRRSLLACIVNG